MKIYLWECLAWSQARLAEQPPCFLLAATLRGQTLCWSLTGRGSSCWGCLAGGTELSLAPLMPAVRSPDSSWAQLGTFCSFSYYCQGQIHPDIRRWDTPWARSVLQQQRAPGRALQGGGTASVWSCSSPTGCLWEQVLPVGLAVLQWSNSAQDSPASRPGGQLKEPTGMQHLVATRSRPSDWCHGNQAGPGTVGIQWVQFPTSPTELRHQAQSWPAGLPLLGFVAFILPSLHLIEEREYMTTCL